MSFGFQVLGFGAYPSRGGPIDATYLVIAVALAGVAMGRGKLE